MEKSNVIRRVEGKNDVQQIEEEFKIYPKRNKR